VAEISALLWLLFIKVLIGQEYLFMLTFSRVGFCAAVRRGKDQPQFRLRHNPPVVSRPSATMVGEMDTRLSEADALFPIDASSSQTTGLSSSSPQPSLRRRVDQYDMSQAFSRPDQHRNADAAEVARGTVKTSHLPRRIGSVNPSDLYDLGTTLVVNSKDGSMHLNRSQREAIFEARKNLYQTSLRQIVIVLQSHLTPLEKCHRLVLLHDKVVVKNRLRLRADTYEEIFHTFYAVSMLGRSDADVTTSLHGVSSATAGQQTLEFSPVRGGGSGDDDSVARDIHTQTSPFLHPVWTMYRYMIDSGTNPTPRIVQHVMGMLSRVRRRNVDIEARAHSLTMDCDRFKFPPSEFTVVDYCRVCTINHAMHLAVARVTDLYTRHEKAPSANVASTLLNGLTVNGHHDKAMAFIATMQNVPITPSLLHSTLQAGRYSQDPSSAFTFYSSLRGSGIRPTHHTISILVEAATLMSDAVDLISEKHSAVQRELQYRGSFESRQSLQQLQRDLEKKQEKLRHAVVQVILKDLIRFKVRVNHRVLNKLLKLLVDVNHRTAFVALCSALIQRQGSRAVFREQFPAEWVAAAEFVKGRKLA
jgi:hypothetical protein